MRDFTDGWYIEYEDGDVSNYMSKLRADEIYSKYNMTHCNDRRTAYLMYDKDFNIELPEDDLTSYGMFNGDFFILVRQGDIFILFVIIGIPDCNMANIPAIIEFLNECENEEISVGNAYKFQGIFYSKLTALERLSGF
mgnify:CR=1 FL=1